MTDYPALARLHACLVTRVDQLSPELQDTYYNEVANQCLNTHEYREAISKTAPHNEYLSAVVTDVLERIKEMHSASESPALQMEVSGLRRGEALHNARLVRSVGKGVAERSRLLNLFTTIDLLYGGPTWRTYSEDRQLSQPFELNTVSSSFEVPRLEVIDPEGSQLAKIAAGVRLEQIAKQLPDETLG
jgi:hypothetical protein